MRSAYIKLHTAILLAGVTAILGKLISLGAASLVWWRLAITVVVMWGWILLNKERIKYNIKDRLTVLGIGALIGLHWLCFFGSVKYSNVSIALVCLSSSGFFSALLEPCMRKTKMVWMEAMLGLVSMAGIYIIFHFDSNYQTGIILGVLAAALSAVFSILNKKIVSAMDTMRITAWEMLGALLLLSLIVPFYIKFDKAAFLPLGYDWTWLLLLSLICTVWAFILQLQSLKHVSAFTMNLSYNLEPIYGIVLAFIFFHENEQLSRQFYIGVLLIVASIFFQMWRVRSSRKKLSR